MDPTQAAPPERIGRYRILGRLGRGGMGDVLLARDDRLDRPVAIKRLRSGLSSDLYPRLEREALAIAQLSHPAVVRIFEALDTDDGIHLVLEFVPGETLSEKLKSGPLPLDQLVNLGREVAEALSEAHQKGILHRDLKTENVMVTSHGHAKILDFGLAKLWSPANPGQDEHPSPAGLDESLTHTGWILGTGRSMSPEQARGESLDGRSDLFSLGVLLYEMATSHSPFRGKTPLETLSNLLTLEEQPVTDLRPGLPPDLASLIHRLMSKVPDQRPVDAETVGRTLSRLEADLGLGFSTAEERDAEPEPETATAAALDLSPQASGGDPFEDLPTGYSPSSDPWAAPSSEPRALEPTNLEPTNLEPTAPARITQPRGKVNSALIRRTLSVILLIATAALILVLLSAPRPTARRVAALEPTVIGADPEGRLAILGAGALDAAIGALVDLEQTGPIGPDQLRGVGGSALEIATANATDELLLIKVFELGGITHIELRRLSTRDGIVLWNRNLSVSSQLEDARQTANLVASEVKRGFKENTGLLSFGGDDRGSSQLKASDHDYRRFLEIQYRTRHQNLPFPEALQQLEQILETSPRLSSAHWLMADLAESLFTDTRQARYLEIARRHVRLAGEDRHWDPRPAVHGFRLALLAGDLDQAATLLETLSDTAPGEPEVLFNRSMLAQARGQTEEAITALERLVERRPSWRYLHQLATLEYRSGRVDAARKHFRQLLQRSPDNTWGLNGLLQLETLHGNLKAAETLALRLLELRPHRSFWTNLGVVRFLLGDYENALRAYEQAAELSPDHPTTLLNLGDSLQALGRNDDAERAFGRALHILSQRQENEVLSPQDRLNKAQCSAHLGDFETAIEETLAILEHADDDSELAYQAALVFALAGEQNSALIKARHALSSGMDARWFNIPAFDELRPLLSLDAQPASEQTSAASGEGKGMP